MFDLIIYYELKYKIRASALTTFHIAAGAAFWKELPIIYTKWGKTKSYW